LYLYVLSILQGVTLLYGILLNVPTAVMIGLSKKKFSQSLLSLPNPVKEVVPEVKQEGSCQV